MGGSGGFLYCNDNISTGFTPWHCEDAKKTPQQDDCLGQFGTIVNMKAKINLLILIGLLSGIVAVRAQQSNGPAPATLEATNEPMPPTPAP